MAAARIARSGSVRTGGKGLKMVIVERVAGMAVAFWRRAKVNNTSATSHQINAATDHTIMKNFIGIAPPPEM